MKASLLVLPLCLAQNDPDTYNVYCPKLECDPVQIEKNLVPGECFSMGTEVVQDSIYARDCFDATEQKKKDAVEMFCPFNMSSGEYAWISETLQYTDRCK